MKHIVFFIFIATLGIQSCKEYLPENTVVTTTLDTTYVNPQPPAPEDRIVLIEEFTGASCVNCPQGHDVLKSLSTTYGDKINIIGLHQSALAKPVRSNDPDLRTPEASSIAAQFGITSMPQALIDRVKYNGQVALGRTFWPSAVSTQTNVPPGVNISTNITSLQSTSCKYKYKIEFPKEYPNEVSYFISLVENGIFVTQKDGSTEIDHYEQNHVLRKMYTPYNGKTLEKKNATYEKGRTYEKEITLDLSTTWNINKCEVIIYVTDNVTGEVLQSKLIHIQ